MEDQPDIMNTPRLIHRIVPVSITLFMLGLSLYLHIVGKTSLTQGDDIWTQRVEVISRTYYALSTRHFTTYSLYALRSLFGLSYRVGFIVLQYFLAAMLAWVFYLYLRALGFNRRWSNLGLFMLLGSYPILAAHFQPVHTWDDFWQYIAQAAAFLLIIRKRPLAASLAFAIGSVAREPIMILYPVYVYALILFADRRNW